MEEFEIIGPSDQAALLGVTTPEIKSAVKTALAELGFKVHIVDDHEQFDFRYNQTNYAVIVIEETFAGSDSLENPSLRLMQNLPMSQRRHATLFLIGPSMETLNTMQAFAQSVHCVINYSEMPMFSELVRKTMAENEMFLTAFRDVQRRVSQKAV
jgi:hypothetical protein